jgi:hypothetical protein
MMSTPKRTIARIEQIVSVIRDHKKHKADTKEHKVDQEVELYKGEPMNYET